MKKTFFIQSTIFVAIFTFLSKLSGFSVDALMAYMYGPSFFNDLYVFIISIISMIFIAVGGAVNTTFSPMLSELIVKESKTEQFKFISNTINVFTIILLGISIIGFVFSKYIVQLFAPGFITNYSEEQINIVISYVKLAFCALALIGVQSVFIGVLNCFKSFKEASAVSIYTNVVLIMFLCFFKDKLGTYGLIYAVILGYVISVFSLLLPLKRVGYKYTFIINFRDEKIKKMFRRVIPVLLGSSVLQLNLIIDSVLSTNVGVGALSILNYASKLNIIITHVVGMAIATVVFPILSELAAKYDKKQFSIVLGNSIRLTNIIIIPITVLIIALKDPIIGILFERGQFNHRDTLQTAEILLYYSPAMVFITLREILNRAFYSLQDTKTPMVISIIGVLINIILKIMLVNYWGLAGVAIATSISVILVTNAQIYLLKNKDVSLIDYMSDFLKIIGISLSIYILPWFIYHNLDRIYGKIGMMGEIYKIGTASFLFFVLYIILLFLFKMIKVSKIKSYLLDRQK